MMQNESPDHSSPAPCSDAKAEAELSVDAKKIEVKHSME